MIFIFRKSNNLAIFTLRRYGYDQDEVVRHMMEMNRKQETLRRFGIGMLLLSGVLATLLTICCLVIFT